MKHLFGCYVNSLRAMQCNFESNKLHFSISFNKTTLQNRLHTSTRMTFTAFPLGRLQSMPMAIIGNHLITPSPHPHPLASRWDEMTLARQKPAGAPLKVNIHCQHWVRLICMRLLARILAPHSTSLFHEEKIGENVLGYNRKKNSWL